jgi:hypothetical protein
MSGNGANGKRRRGRSSLYNGGGVSALRRGTAQPTDALQGLWTREELQRMHNRFVAAVEAAIARGLERRSSAGASVRPHPGDLDRLPPGAFA